MEALSPWGWDSTWAQHFSPHGSEGLLPGRISIEQRGLYHFHGPHGEGVAHISGRFRHQASGRDSFPAVGDWVALRLLADTGPGLIEAVLPRKNKLSRQAAGGTGEEQILAANLDVLFLVTSLNRDLNLRRIERFLAAAPLPGCLHVLLLTKSDLCDTTQTILSDLCATLRGIPVHALSAQTGEGLEALTGYLQFGKTAAMLGSSGVGKSTLVNRLAGQQQLTQPVRKDDDRGRHTTTHRELIRLPLGGMLIDSPGIRELRLWVDGSDVSAAFDDITELALGCPFSDCTHTHEPRCAIRQAILDQVLDQARLDSYHKLQREMDYEEARGGGRAGRERKEREKRLHRAIEKHKRRKQDG